MTWVEALDALDALADHPHVAHYRRLCSDENTDVVVRDAWRLKIVRKAHGEPSPASPAVTPHFEIPVHVAISGGCCGGSPYPD